MSDDNELKYEEIKNEIKNQNIPEKHLEINNISEIVVSKILNKLINGIVIDNDIDYIYGHMNTHCFNFIHNCLNSYISTVFVHNENGMDDNNINQEEIFFKDLRSSKINTWKEIKEPHAPDNDRYLASQISVKPFIKVDNSINDLKNDLSKSNHKIKLLSKNQGSEHSIKELLSHKGSIPENQKDDELQNNKINNKELKKRKVKSINKNLDKKIEDLDKSQKNIKRESKTEAKKEREKDKKLILTQENENNNKEGEEEEIDNNPIIDLPSYDLAKEKYENYYALLNSSEENNLLRKERFNEIQKKKEQELAEKAKAKADYYKRFQLKMSKEFDNNRVSFDPNGKIIYLRLPNVDSLPGDFYVNKPIIKETLLPNKKYENTDNHKQKDILTKKNNAIKGSQIKKISVLKTEEIERNPADSPFKNPYMVNSPLALKKKEPVKPSGSNFETIIPEIGVVLVSDDKKKKREGSFDYLKLFNKPSMKEFRELVISNNNLNSKKFLSSDFSQIDNLNTSNSQDYIGYKEEFSEINNPLFQGAVKDISPINTSKPTSGKKEKKIFNKDLYDAFINKYPIIDSKNFNREINNNKRRQLLKSFDALKNNKKISQSLDTFNCIQISNKNNNQNLQNYFHEQQDTIIMNPILPRKSLDTSNRSINSYLLSSESYLAKAIQPFKRYRIQKRDLPLITESEGNKNVLEEFIDEKYINKFNLDIIKNKDWGYYKNMKSNDYIEEEPENEIGQNFRRLKRSKFKYTGQSVVTEVNTRKRNLPVRFLDKLTKKKKIFK